MNSPFNILRSKRIAMLKYQIIVIKCANRNRLFFDTAILIIRVENGNLETFFVQCAHLVLK
jgi:hypothetical protein